MEVEKEYKPKYKLTIKYPRLPLKFESGDIVYYNALSKAYVREKFPHYAVDVNEVENNPDFWELIEEKPLFVTEDGVDKFYSNQTLWDLKKLMSRIAWVASKDSKYYAIANQCFAEASSNKDKLFKQEPNADKYIEENKPEPLFTTEDGVEVHCRDWELFGVEVSTFKRAVVTSKSLNRHSFLLFANKHNADEYIWRNKRVFSYEDVLSYHETQMPDVLLDLAKERSGNEKTRSIF